MTIGQVLAVAGTFIMMLAIVQGIRFHPSGPGYRDERQHRFVGWVGFIAGCIMIFIGSILHNP